MVVRHTFFMHLCFICVLSCSFACSCWSSSAPFFPPFYLYSVILLFVCKHFFLYPHCDYVSCSFGACPQWFFRDWNKCWVNERMNELVIFVKLIAKNTNTLSTTYTVWFICLQKYINPLCLQKAKWVYMYINIHLYIYLYLCVCKYVDVYG